MSRIGKLPVSIPAGVTVTLKDNVVNVKGPKGELSQFVNPAIEVEIADGHVVLKENENATSLGSNGASLEYAGSPHPFVNSCFSHIAFYLLLN